MLKRLFIFLATRMMREDQRPELYRRLLGVKVGVGSKYTGAINFGSEPFLVEIGSGVTLAQGTTFLTHDGGVRLFRSEHPGLNVYGRIVVGDNVFIGSSVTILPGVTIGNNVVIGACSLVTKSIPSDVVVGGVPARILKSIDDYRRDVLEKGVFIDGQGERETLIVSALNRAALLKQGRSAPKS